jgi:hypothetical protein
MRPDRTDITSHYCSVNIIVEAMMISMEFQQMDLLTIFRYDRHVTRLHQLLISFKLET